MNLYKVPIHRVIEMSIIEIVTDCIESELNRTSGCYVIVAQWKQNYYFILFVSLTLDWIGL